MGILDKHVALDVEFSETSSTDSDVMQDLKPESCKTQNSETYKGMSYTFIATYRNSHSLRTRAEARLYESTKRRRSWP